MVSRASPIEVPSDDEDDFVKLKSWYEQQALSEEEDDARGPSPDADANSTSKTGSANGSARSGRTNTPSTPGPSSSRTNGSHQGQTGQFRAARPSPETPTPSSSRRIIPDVEDPFDTDVEDDGPQPASAVDDELAGVLPKLNIGTRQSTPVGKAATMPSMSPSTPSSAARSARDERLRAACGTPNASQPSSPSPAGASPPTPQPRAGNPANMARASTMPTPNTQTRPAQSMPRSHSMQNGANSSFDTSTPRNLGPDYIDIAHDARVQVMMDQLNLSWGTQYELARGVSIGIWEWEDVTRDKLRALATARRGQCSPQRVGEVMGKNLGGVKLEIWDELHREQRALVEREGRGLGLMGDFEGESNWYGGRIQQLARLVRSPSGTYHLELGAMQKVGRSHRLARYLGSRRVLQVKLPQKATYDEKEMSVLKKFFSKKFVLCGRVFAAFSVKDEKVYLVETNEDFQRTPKESEGDDVRYSLGELVDWYNPLALNNKQSLSKYAARADLALSTSVPVLEFEAKNIFKWHDEYAPYYGNKPPAEKIFTDGCGFMNGAALMKIGSWMGFGTPPTAVQGRILGSKGVWLLHPEDRAPDAEPRIWIRASQMKIQLVAQFNESSLHELHRAHKIFDLVMPSRSTVPARLSRLTIVNLEHNKVPADVIVKLMEDGLKQEVAALTQWEGSSAMPLLWNAVNKASGVSFQRLRRTAAGLQRALGLTRRRNEDDSDDEDDVGGTPGASQASDADDDADTLDVPPDVDMPSDSIGETLLDRLQAGFTPLKDYFVYDDLKWLIKQVMTSYIKDYHIVVPESAEAFIVPDPYGVLEEGEIHFKSSQDLKDGCQHLHPKLVTGDVLLYRNPARLPSDIQKVRAVYHPALADYVDVIVLPTKGSRSLASLMAGGDVDGDVAVCVFDQTIVQSFSQPAFTPEPPNFLAEYFKPLDQVPTVASLVKRMDAEPANAGRILQEGILIGLTHSRVGRYSGFHEFASYVLGYGHKDTVRLAYMFNTVLDSRKTGLVVQDHIVQADAQRFGKDKPICLGGSTTGSPPRRPEKLGRFILDQLLDAGKVIQDQLLIKYNELGAHLSERTQDPHLLQPWQDLYRAKRCLAPAVQQEVELLKAHVDVLQGEWSRMWSGPGRGNAAYANREQQKQLKKLDKEKVLDLARRYAQTPAGCGTLALLGNLDRLKASYAYSLKPKFAYKVGFQALCKIKAEKDGSKAFTKEFAEAMSISGAEVRVRSQFNTQLELS